MPPVSVSPADAAKSELIREDAFAIMADGASDGAGGGVDATPGIGSLSAPYQAQTKDFAESLALAMIRGIGAQIRQVVQLFNNSDGSGNPASKTTGSFTTSAGTKLIVFASGSGFHSTGNAVIGMDLKVDSGATFGTVKSYTNESGSHKAFVSQIFLVTGLSAASHTITATKLSGTQWDANDFLSITIVEVQV